MLRGFALVALLAVVALGLAAPMAAGDHCRTGIHAFGRISLAPTSPPPYAADIQRVCPSAAGAEHTLPPQSDQVIVRINGDFGSGVPTVLVSLDGLGFAGQSFTLKRTANLAGGYSYQMSEWVNLPLGPQVGELTVTAYYPGNVVMRSTYRSVA